MERLYISDLDGTLLNADSELGADSKTRLNRLLSDGLQFTICTLRSIESIRPLFAGVDLQIPIIELNGAFITDVARNGKLRINAIAPEIKRHLFEGISRNSANPIVLSFDDGDNLYFNRATNPGEAWYYESRKAAGDRRLKAYGNFEDIHNERWVCVTLIDERDRLEELRETIEAQFPGALNINMTPSIQTPDYVWLTVSSREASKGHAVEYLKSDCGFSDHEIVTFGDQPIDIPMFDAADVSIAVENAHDDVKNKADKVIGNHNDDAVVSYMESEWRGQKGERSSYR